MLKQDKLKFRRMLLGAGIGGAAALAASIKLAKAQNSGSFPAGGFNGNIGVATGTSLALGGATLGSNVLAVGGGPSSFLPTGATYPISIVYVAGSGNYASPDAALQFGSDLQFRYSPNYGSLLLMDPTATTLGNLMLNAVYVGGLSATENAVFGAGGVELGNTAWRGANRAINIPSTSGISWSSTTAYSGAADVFIARAAAATLQFGDVDAATPVAQTIQVQSVVGGTAATAGADFTIQGSRPTGASAGGAIVFKTAPAGGSGTTQTAAAEVVRILPAGLVKFTNAANFTANGSTLWAVGSNCPGNGTVQEWLTIQDSAGTTRYIPCF